MGRHRSTDVSAARERRRRIWIPLASGLLALILAWLILPTGASPFANPLGSASESSTPEPSNSGVPGTATTWAPTTPDPSVATPGDSPVGAPVVTALRVSIPSIEVDSPLTPLSLDPDSGVLIPPQSYDIAGVYADGPVPGQRGPAVVAGHVDSPTGPAVFYRLEEMVVGDTISVSLSDGERIDFRVIDVASYPKIEFPTDLVYGPTPARELRLITCGGGFDRSRSTYADNIVVYAVRV